MNIIQQENLKNPENEKFLEQPLDRLANIAAKVTLESKTWGINIRPEHLASYKTRPQKKLELLKKYTCSFCSYIV